MSETPGSTEAGLGSAKGGARSGAANILVIIIGVVALIGLGAAGFMFMQLSSAKKQLADADLPDGLKEEDQHAEEHSDHGSDDAPETAQVIFELGDFTANSSDGKFVKMNLALVVKSFYPRDDWENYRIQLDKYEQQRQEYFEFERGSMHGEGHASLAPGTYVVALLTGAGPAVASAPKKEPEPPTMPSAPPSRPLTRMEGRIREDDALVRNIIITQINTHTATEMISAEGKQDFKNKVIEAINESFDSAYGEVVDIYFRELVTT